MYLGWLALEFGVRYDYNGYDGSAGKENGVCKADIRGFLSYNRRCCSRIISIYFYRRIVQMLL